MRPIDADALIHDNVDFFDSAHGEDTAKDFKDIVNEAPTVPNFGSWISVEDRLPKIGVPVLVFANADNWGQTVYYVEIDVLMEDELWDKNGSKVTHWMPIPAPPKEGE